MFGTTSLVVEYERQLDRRSGSLGVASSTWCHSISTDLSQRSNDIFIVTISIRESSYFLGVFSASSASSAPIRIVLIAISSKKKQKNRKKNYSKKKRTLVGVGARQSRYDPKKKKEIKNSVKTR